MRNRFNRKDYIQKLLHSLWIIRIIDYSKSNSIIGFGKIPIYEVFQFFLITLTQGALGIRAAAVAFNFFLGLFPAVIFFFTLIPYIPIENFHAELLVLIQRLTPPFAFQTIETTITDIALTKQGGLLSFGFISAMYFSTKGIQTLIMAFNASSLKVEARSWFNLQLISFFLMILVVATLSVAIFLITITDPVLEFLVEYHVMYQGFVYYLIIVGNWFVIVLLFFIIISTLYYFAPSSKVNWHFFSIGSVIATILSIIISTGFTFYVSHFGQYNKLYGSLGTLIVILMWLYLMSYVILLGFELNNSIKTAITKHQC